MYFLSLDFRGLCVSIVFPVRNDLFLLVDFFLQQIFFVCSNKIIFRLFLFIVFFSFYLNHSWFAQIFLRLFQWLFISLSYSNTFLFGVCVFVVFFRWFVLLLLFHSIGSPSVQVFFERRKKNIVHPEKKNVQVITLEKLSRLFFERVSLLSLRVIYSLEAMPTVKHHTAHSSILLSSRNRFIAPSFLACYFWTFKQTRLVQEIYCDRM